MHFATLAAQIQNTEILKKILGDYRGGMSIGIYRDPYTYQLTIRVRVEAGDVSKFPDSIMIDDEEVPITVVPNFVIPTNWGTRPEYARPQYVEP